MDLAQRLEYQNKWGSFHLDILQIRKTKITWHQKNTPSSIKLIHIWTNGDRVWHFKWSHRPPHLFSSILPFWHNVWHWPPRDPWNNSYFSLLESHWITEFQFISLIYFMCFLKVYHAWLFCLSIDPHQHFTTNDIPSHGPSVLCKFKFV